jgi:hypothetical protein
MIELTLAVLAVLGLSWTAWEIQVLEKCSACEIVDIMVCGEGMSYDPRAGECVQDRDLL